MNDITVNGLSFRYADSDQLILQDVNMRVREGDFVCLLGQSGCGKSTFLRLMAGLEAPSSGSICVDGQPIDGTSLERSVVFQDYGLFPWMSAGENIVLALRQRFPEKSKAECRGIARRALREVGLKDEVFGKYPKSLSGGMKQRCAIARSFSMNPPILLMDEPFGALDVKTRCSLQKLVDALWRSGEQRKTVVFVTHDINEAILLADRVVFMRRGEIVADRAVDVPRPRSSAIFAHDACARALKDELTDLFYLDGEEDEEGGAFGEAGAGVPGALPGKAVLP